MPFPVVSIGPPTTLSLLQTCKADVDLMGNTQPITATPSQSIHTHSKRQAGEKRSKKPPSLAPCRRNTIHPTTHAAAPPAAAPNSSEAPLPDDLVQHDLLGVDDVQVVPLEEVPGLHGPVEAEAELGIGSGHEPVRPGEGGQRDPVPTLRSRRKRTNERKNDDGRRKRMCVVITANTYAG